MLACGSSTLPEHVAQVTLPRAQPLLDRYLEQVHTLSGRLDQTLIDAEGTVLEEASGTLEISRPGRFRWTTAAIRTVAGGRRPERLEL